MSLNPIPPRLSHWPSWCGACGTYHDDALLFCLQMSLPVYSTEDASPEVEALPRPAKTLVSNQIIQHIHPFKSQR